MNLARPLTHEVLENGCWRCTSHKPAPNEYIVVHGDGKTTHAHRYLWEKLRGPIPSGMIVGHVCNHKWCIRPDHLALMTQSRNVKDAYKDGLAVPWNKIFSDKEVREIREDERSSTIIAEELGTSTSTIKAIKTRQNYKEVV